MSRPPGLVQRALTWPFLMAIRVYQVTLSPFIGGQCRFEPTCSRYGIEAYRLYGPLKGTWLTFRRVLRCHPLGGGGYDPVPLPWWYEPDDGDGVEGERQGSGRPM